MGLGNLGKIIKGVGKGLSGKDAELNAGAKVLFKKVAKGEEDAMYQHILPYKLNGKVGVALAIGVGATTVIGSSVDSRQLAQMGGKVTAGELSGMTDAIQLSPLVQDMQKGKQVNFNNSLRNDGASGDIVFALHNMR